MNFHVTVGMDDKINLMTRTRYNVWDLLGDVGGFSGGLFLFCSVFMSTYTAVVFKVDWLRSQVLDNGDSTEAHAFRGSTNFTRAVQDLRSKQDGQTGKLRKETIGVISWV